MDLSIKSVRDYLQVNQGVGQIVLAEYEGGAAPELEKASFLHKVKSFFGSASAKAENQATINAIRTAIRNDPNLYAVSGEADRLLGQVKGTITAEKLSSILNTLDDLVANSSKEEYANMARDSVSGQFAAKGAPGFLQSRGLDKNQQFMA